jgi:hypothetical protein
LLISDLRKTLKNRKKSGKRLFAGKERQEKGRKMSVYPTIDTPHRRQASWHHLNIFFAKASWFSDFFVTLHCV